MQTILTGHMGSQMVKDVTRALERFSGREVKVTIDLFSGKKPKADPPNDQQSKNAPAKALNLNGEGNR
jgi:hypothetical protein